MSYLLASIVYGANNENRNGGQCRVYFLFYMWGGRMASTTSVLPLVDRVQLVATTIFSIY